LDLIAVWNWVREEQGDALIFLAREGGFSGEKCLGLRRGSSGPWRSGRFWNWMVTVELLRRWLAHWST